MSTILDLIPHADSGNVTNVEPKQKHNNNNSNKFELCEIYVEVLPEELAHSSLNPLA